MIYIESPEECKYVGYDRSLFLGGGIRGCADWQKEMVHKLKDTNLRVYNPRREVRFNKDDPYARKDQIVWEHKHMRKADAITFWFPIEATSSMTIFELGAWLPRPKKIFLGFDSNYSRKESFTIQAHLERPSLEIVYSIDDMVKQILKWYDADFKGTWKGE